MRSALVLILTLSSLGARLSTAADPLSTAMVVWSEDVVSPGVCVEKGTWFVSVIPEEVSIDGIETARLRTSEGEKTGRVLYLDESDRLCLIEVDSAPAAAQPVPLGECLIPKPGEKAECLSGNEACRSTVAGKDWSYRGERFPLPLLRLRVSESGSPCGPGTPLVCEEGNLIGILTDHSLEATGEVYAIPAARVRKLVEDVKRHNRSGPVWIGLLLHKDSSTPEVIEVKPGSPAEKAGVKEGDVILSVAGQAIESFDDLVESVHSLPAGETVDVRVLRGLEEQKLTITPQFAELAAAQ